MQQNNKEKDELECQDGLCDGLELCDCDGICICEPDFDLDDVQDDCDDCCCQDDDEDCDDDCDEACDL